MTDDGTGGQIREWLQTILGKSSSAAKQSKNSSSTTVSESETEPTQDEETEPTETPASETESQKKGQQSNTDPSPRVKGQQVPLNQGRTVYEVFPQRDATGIPNPDDVEFLLGGLTTPSGQWDEMIVSIVSVDNELKYFVRTTLPKEALAMGISGTRETAIEPLDISCVDRRIIHTVRPESQEAICRGFRLSVKQDMLQQSDYRFARQMDINVPSFKQIQTAIDNIPHPTTFQVLLQPTNSGRSAEIAFSGQIYFEGKSSAHLQTETTQALEQLCEDTKLTYEWRSGTDRSLITGDLPQSVSVETDALIALFTLHSGCNLFANVYNSGDDRAGELLWPYELERWFKLGRPYRTDGTQADTPLFCVDWPDTLRVLRLTAATKRARPSADVDPPMAHIRNISEITLKEQPVFVFDIHGHAAAQLTDIQRLVAPELFVDGDRDKEPAREDRPRVEYVDVSETLSGELGDRERVEYNQSLEKELLDAWNGMRTIIFDLSKSATPRMDASSIFSAFRALAKRVPELVKSKQATLAIDDPLLALTDSQLESLVSSTAFDQRCNLLLNVRHPLAGSPATEMSIDPSTTRQQETLISNIITSKTDILLAENDQRVSDIIDRSEMGQQIKEVLREQITRPVSADWHMVLLNAEQRPFATGSLNQSPDLPSPGCYLASRDGGDEYLSSLRSNREDYTKTINRDYTLKWPVSPKECHGGTHILNGDVNSVRWNKFEQPAKITAKKPEPDTEATQTTDRTHNISPDQPATGEVTSRVARPAQVNKTNLPQGATVNEHSNNYVCEHCGERYDLTQKGLHRVCQCCEKSVELVDRERLREIPPIRLKLSEEEIEASPLSQDQLRLLKAIYLAKRFRFDPVSQFDPLTDSMKLIIGDLGIDSDAVESLCDYTDDDNQAYLSKQTSTTVHTVYNITSAGRTHIREPAKEGYDWGVGQGDLNESTLHRIGVALLCYWLSDEYADDPDRSVTAYHKLPNGKVIDAVVLDGTGEVVVAAEMECENNDVTGEGSSPRSTYSKLAAVDLEEAIWVFETGGHWEAATADLATASTGANDEFDFREKGYSRSYLSSNPKLEFSGMTKAMTLSTLSKLAPYPPGLYGRDPTRFLSK